MLYASQKAYSVNKGLFLGVFLAIVRIHGQLIPNRMCGFELIMCCGTTVSAKAALSAGCCYD